MILSRRALFLDRDGVINVDHGYVSRQEDFLFVDGIFELCRAAKRNDYLIIVVTNQAGIGRGYYTEEAFWTLTDWMCGFFRAEGADIDGVYFCPTHPEHGIGKFRVESVFRKPGPGMLLQAADDFKLDLPGSLLVGDKESDIMAGIAAGVGRNVIFSQKGSFAGAETYADAEVKSLVEVCKFLSSFK